MGEHPMKSAQPVYITQEPSEQTSPGPWLPRFVPVQGNRYGCKPSKSYHRYRHVETENLFLASPISEKEKSKECRVMRTV